MANSEEIRAWVYEFLKQGGTNRDLGGVEQHIKSKLQQAGEFPSGPADVHRELETSIKDQIREIIWSLVIQGFVTPGTNNRQANLPFFQITDWGRICLEKGGYLPYDAAQYISRLKGQISSIDQGILLYLQESLTSFRAGVHLASAVMTGVACERTLLLLRESVEDALPTPQRKAKFADNTRNKPIKQVSEEIWKRLEPVHQQLAKNVGQEDLRAELSGIFDLIRKTRNEAGHPTGRQISREEAHNLLLLFPQYCQAVYRTMNWLRAPNLLP